MSSIPVTCSKSEGVLSYVSFLCIFAQVAFVDNVYLIKVGYSKYKGTDTFWLGFFLSQLLFQNLYSLRTPTVSKQQYFSKEILFQKMLVAINSFIGNSHISGIKICSHSILPKDFLSAYFRTPVSMKKTSYQSSYFFKAASIILKWEQPFEVAKFTRKYIFQNT